MESQLHSANLSSRVTLPAFEAIEIGEPISVWRGKYDSAVELRKLLQEIFRPHDGGLTLLVAMDYTVRPSDLPGLAGEIGPIDRLVLTEKSISDTVGPAPQNLDRIGEALGGRQTVYEHDLRRGVVGTMQLLRAGDSFVAIFPSKTNIARALIDAGAQWRASFESADEDGFFPLPLRGPWVPRAALPHK